MIVEETYSKPVPSSVNLKMSFEEARDLYEILSSLGLQATLPESLYRVFRALIQSSVPRKLGQS